MQGAMSRWMWMMAMAAGTSNERSSSSTIGDYGNFHLLLGSNLALVAWAAVGGNSRERVSWIG